MPVGSMGRATLRPPRDSRGHTIRDSTVSFNLKLHVAFACHCLHTAPPALAPTPPGRDPSLTITASFYNPKRYIRPRTDSSGVALR